jgi:hypothetical protein
LWSQGERVSTLFPLTKITLVGASITDIMIVVGGKSSDLRRLDAGVKQKRGKF